MSYAIFLGAGASKSFGFPLTSEVLPRVRSRLRAKQLFDGISGDKRQESRLRSLLKCLLPGIDEIEDKNLPLITEILSLVDYSLLSASVSSKALSRNDLEELRRLLERAIVETLEWPYTSLDVPPRLRRFADWLYQLASAGESIAIISTNYDISVETELFHKLDLSSLADKVDFGLEWRNPWRDQLHCRPQNPFYRLFKLHGSLNWLHCPLCDHIYINTKGSIIHNAFKKVRDNQSSCHCGYWPLAPLIVAPSTVRDVRNSNLVEVWRHSLEALRRAEQWIMIGYSFPSEDVAIRSMFLRAYSSRAMRPEVEVVQLSDLSHAGGQRQVVRRIVEQRITRDFHFVIVNVGMRPGQANRLRVGDEVNLVAALGKFQSEFGGHYAAATIRRITSNANLHAVLSGLSCSLPFDGNG